MFTLSFSSVYEGNIEYMMPVVGLHFLIQLDVDSRFSEDWLLEARDK